MASQSTAVALASSKRDGAMEEDNLPASYILFQMTPLPPREVVGGSEAGTR